ncbi:hypothetical protein NL676_030550 [Syzygium grande]|nr:hypothetical protein NL676_030550 [Syzygium grande]
MCLTVCDSTATASLTSNDSPPELPRVIFLVDCIPSLPLPLVWIRGGNGGSSNCDRTSMLIKYCKKNVDSAKSDDSTIEDDLKAWVVQVDQATLFGLILISRFFSSSNGSLVFYGVCSFRFDFRALTRVYYAKYPLSSGRWFLLIGLAGDNVKA